jgi:NAD(P)-dependent dehydrogenase (short-subunit alcohol dehydrogenase family)
MTRTSNRENTGHTVSELAGLTAVVTGAGFGIGLATAENFTAADARVLSCQDAVNTRP